MGILEREVEVAARVSLEVADLPDDMHGRWDRSNNRLFDGGGDLRDRLGALNGRWGRGRRLGRFRRDQPRIEDRPIFFSATSQFRDTVTAR